MKFDKIIEQISNVPGDDKISTVNKKLKKKKIKIIDTGGVGFTATPKTKNQKPKNDNQRTLRKI